MCVVRVCFLGGRGVILIGSAYELTGNREPMSCGDVFRTSEKSLFSCLEFKTLLTK